MENLELFCKRCKKSMKIAYLIVEDDDALVLEHVRIKCHHCKRILTFKKYTERMLKESAENGRVYI